VVTENEVACSEFNVRKMIDVRRACLSEESWITFDEERDGDDQTVPTFQPDDEQETEEAEDDEEEEEDGDTDDAGSRPERPPPPPGPPPPGPPSPASGEQQKTRDEIAMERALAKYSAQLERGQ